MTEVKCEHCGAMNNIEEGYCKECWKKLPQGVALEGIGKLQWKQFIDFKSERYFKRFAKNKGKKFFISLNFAAFFFGIRWMMYRKMYKYAIILTLIATLTNATATVALTFSHREEIKELNRVIVAAEGDIEIGYGSGGTYIEMTDQQFEASNKLAKLSAEIENKSTLLNSVFMFGLLLFGDSLYKMHVKKNVNSPSMGGTNIWMGLFGGTLLSLPITLVVGPVFEIVMSIIVNT